jgi:hypothetical protein
MLYTNLGGHPSWQGVCDKSFLPCLQNGPLMGTGFGEAWTGSDEGEYKNARFSQFSAERRSKTRMQGFYNYTHQVSAEVASAECLFNLTYSVFTIPASFTRNFCDISQFVNRNSLYFAATTTSNNHQIMFSLLRTKNVMNE